MVSEIFESLFWVGPGFIPKSHLVECLSDNEKMESDVVKQTKHISSIKLKATISGTFVRLTKKDRK
jgi:hypothetical protein